MTAKIKMRQYVMFVKPRKFDTTDIKYSIICIHIKTYIPPQGSKVKIIVLKNNHIAENALMETRMYDNCLHVQPRTYL